VQEYQMALGIETLKHLQTNKFNDVYNVYKKGRWKRLIHVYRKTFSQGFLSIPVKNYSIKKS